MLEQSFLNVHGDEFSYRENIKQELIQSMKENCPDVSNEVINLFVKSRIYMRCKYLNKKRVEEAMLKRKENALKRKASKCNDLARSNLLLKFKKFDFIYDFVREKLIDPYF